MTQKNIVLANCGLIDPRRIDTFLSRDGFKALVKARKEMTPEQVVEEVKASGLRGRGGAGFPCGQKLDLTRKAPGDEKYIICNADEGEVGTFKDRYILENDPFTLVEAMAIAGYATGAHQGYIYLRAEYHYLLDLLRNAVRQAKETGHLGDFDIYICEGAGAYVCGEESALMDSIEGKRGEVRYRPPFPPVRGLWQKPTIINNVESLMNIPQIIRNGAKWFAQFGTERSKGTKVFSVSGDVRKAGVYEIVLGSTLRELVVDIAAGNDVKMIQIGGATGRILPASMLDTLLSFETILGAGAVTVFNQSRDVIDVVYRTMEFLAEESCGKCTPCRQGTQAMVGILEKFAHNKADSSDRARLDQLARAMMLSSLCGLGQAAPNPVVDTLQHFSNDYMSRVKRKSGVAV